ncbi:MAG: hypothetical protein ACD_79C00737G0003 [uncultured bacterium]|nr:MAG: hypothetical protein ACD_79C00737G0003 [uncultured bacterium]
MKKNINNIAIIFSDIPSDGSRHPDDSAESTVIEIEKALKPLKTRIIRIPYPCSKKDILKIIGDLIKFKIDYVFNFCEEVNNNSYYEASIVSILDVLEIPYSGNKPETLFFCRDKMRVSSFLSGFSIPVPKAYVVNHESEIQNLDTPKIIKPCCEDGSLGISRENVCKTTKELKNAFNKMKKIIHGPAIIEDFIAGGEINVSVLGSRAFAVSEVVYNFNDSHPNILTYEAKWDSESPIYKNSTTRCPAQIPEKLALKVKSIAEEVFKILNMRHYARVDFRLKDGKYPYVIDVNPNPCIAPDSGFVKALKTYSLNYKKIIEIFLSI